jgi:hypothetical protein
MDVAQRVFAGGGHYLPVAPAVRRLKQRALTADGPPARAVDEVDGVQPREGARRLPPPAALRCRAEGQKAKGKRQK